ncbi:GyrI-like domain-containing protein [Balneola vulgaris]|jgi:predicted transcriptional regulator YdeE|uniref:GyrI-like domain-containing protein n=1 Tax=Balneola vulgaris TaxID=287535 RepID=UPI0003805032|nr:GyrI-like domain-containing protein [Balneola vulgaris]
MKRTVNTLQLIGLALPHKTVNSNGQSGIDCGAHWQKFETEQIPSLISNKVNESIIAVYHDYESDHTSPFSYFIGCWVEEGTTVPEGLDSLQIPAGIYHKVEAQGVLPNCIAEAWQEIWNSEIPRTYTYDFEVYDDRSQNWENGIVDIYLSIKE